MFRKITFFSALFLLSLSLQAGLFQITCTGTCPSQILELARQIENDINDDLPDANASTYLTGMANANVLSGKHIGTDYANDINAFIVALGLGTGLDLGNQKFGDVLSGDVEGNQIRGVGIQPSALLGINLGLFDLPSIGPVDLKRLKVFLNIGAYDKKSDSLSFKTKNFGIHFRYKWKDPIMTVPGRMLYWTGVDFTTGFESQSLELTIAEAQNQSFTYGIYTATVSGTVRAGVKSQTMSIPFEISTGVQLGYIFTLYGGAGVDYNTGSAEATVGSVAPINLNPNVATLTGSLNLGQKSSPDAFGARLFTGLQFNLPFLKVANIQLDNDLVNKTWAIGLRALAITW